MKVILLVVLALVVIIAFVAVVKHYDNTKREMDKHLEAGDIEQSTYNELYNVR